MAQFGFVVDVTRCIGCRSCVAACIHENNLPPYLHWREVLEVESGYSTDQANLVTVSLACNHCAEPACLKACPVGAIEKDGATPGSFTPGNDTGAVLIDETRCIGCRRCQAACPYGAPRYDPAKQKMTKCTLCHHRLASNSGNDYDKVPACVATCPGKALWFGEVSSAPTYGKQISTAASTPPAGFADPAYTSPSIQFAKVAT